MESFVIAYVDPNAAADSDSHDGPATIDLTFSEMQSSPGHVNGSVALLFKGIQAASAGDKRSAGSYVLTSNIRAATSAVLLRDSLFSNLLTDRAATPLTVLAQVTGSGVGGRVCGSLSGHARGTDSKDPATPLPGAENEYTIEGTFDVPIQSWP